MCSRSGPGHRPAGATGGDRRHDHPDLLELQDWLAGLGVTDVVMESTGVYWKPVYYVLENAFTVILVNAAHVKHVPGRKTDTIDAVCWPNS